MSSHYKFEVHIKMPDENDDEDAQVQEFAERVADFARLLHFEVRVTDVERT